MRLTDEFKTMELVDYVDKYDIKGFSGCPSDEQKRYAKLGQLEDIEEELGIDLIIFGKALANGIYTTYYGYIKGDNLRIEKFRIGIPCYSCSLPFKGDFGYGKTWALTKEELE